jgi:hypothetical protein
MDATDSGRMSREIHVRDDGSREKLRSGASPVPLRRTLPHCRAGSSDILRLPVVCVDCLNRGSRLGLPAPAPQRGLTEAVADDDSEDDKPLKLPGPSAAVKKAVADDDSEDDKPLAAKAPAAKQKPSAAKKPEKRKAESEKKEPKLQSTPQKCSEKYVQKWIELCESSDEIKEGAQIEYKQKVGVLKRKKDNTGKTAWVIECIHGVPHIGEEYQDPFAFAIDGEVLTSTSFKDERQSFAVKKLSDVENQTAQKIATEKRRSIRYRAAPQDQESKTLRDLLSKSSKNSPTKMPAAAAGVDLSAIANETAVDDGAPCAYACGFSERRAARASACVIGSR